MSETTAFTTPREVSGSARYALMEHVATAIMAAIGIPIVMYFLRGVRSWSELLTVGVLSGAAALAFYSGRNAWRGLPTVVVTEADVTVKDRRSTRNITWDNVANATYTLDGNERWTLTRRDGGKPFVIAMDGFDRERTARLEKLIRAHIPE